MATNIKPQKMGNEQEIDFLKCVIKVLLKPAGADKPNSIPWEEVAGCMKGEVKPKGDTLRKRFDKIKKEILALGIDEAEDEAEGGEAAPVKKARALAKSKFTKAAAKALAKSKAKVEEAEDEDEDAEDAVIAKVEDGSQEDEDAETTPVDTTPEEKKVKKAAKPRKPKAVKESVTAEFKVNKKHARSEDDKSEITAGGSCGEDELAGAGLPTPPPAKKGRASKKDLAAKDIEELEAAEEFEI